MIISAMYYGLMIYKYCCSFYDTLHAIVNGDDNIFAYDGRNLREISARLRRVLFNASKC